MSDYYEILGISKNASKDEIKSAFRKLARQWHPDVNKAPEAEAKFKELGKAYETLMDDDKRATYDRFGEDGLQNSGFSSRDPFTNGFGDLEEVFNSFFRGAGFDFNDNHKSNANGSQRGEDLRLDIELDFEEAVFGLTKEIKFDHLEVCPSCKGTGAKDGSKPTTCKTCGGRGSIQQTTRTILGHFTQIVTCPHCHGSGTIISKPCTECKGEGRKAYEKKIELKIPAGINNGAKMRLAHEGNIGLKGGVAGDLYVVIHIKPSQYYKRDGMNVYTELSITPIQAVLGDIVAIKTLDGEKEISIPAGIQHGETIKIKGVGIPSMTNPSIRGEHIVIINIKIPTRISNDEKILYEKLYELQTGKKNIKVKERIKSVFR